MHRAGSEEKRLYSQNIRQLPLRLYRFLSADKNLLIFEWLRDPGYGQPLFALFIWEQNSLNGNKKYLFRPVCSYCIIYYCLCCFSSFSFIFSLLFGNISSNSTPTGISACSVRAREFVTKPFCCAKEAWFHSLVAKQTKTLPTRFVVVVCGMFSVFFSRRFSGFLATKENVHQQHGKEKTLRKGFVL